MKKLFIKLSIFCVLLIISMLVIILIPFPENTYSFAIIDKSHILANTDSPKIVLVGGSNLVFGIDSAAVQNRFHLPVVNMGFTRGIGLGRMLDDVSPFLHKGDTLLIIPEYEHFTRLWNGNEEAYSLIFDSRKLRLLWSSYYGMPERFLAYLRLHLRFLITRIGIVSPNPPAFFRDGFNKHGDYVKHLENENQPFNSCGNLGLFNRSYLNRFFRFIDDYSSRGITVILSYPSYEEQSFRNSTMLIQELDKSFREKKNLHVISRPEDYYFPADLCYNTVYHLNAKGRAIRTERLVRDLQASGLLPAK